MRVRGVDPHGGTDCRQKERRQQPTFHLLKVKRNGDDGIGAEEHRLSTEVAQYQQRGVFEMFSIKHFGGEGHVARRR